MELFPDLKPSLSPMMKWVQRHNVAITRMMINSEMVRAGVPDPVRDGEMIFFSGPSLEEALNLLAEHLYLEHQIPHWKH